MGGISVIRSTNLRRIRLIYLLMTWEPMSGFEPLACRLQEVRPDAPSALAAQMTWIVALTALTTLGLSDEPFHEPFHARSSHVPSSCYCA
jgi:hypothetical protein